MDTLQLSGACWLGELRAWYEFRVGASVPDVVFTFIMTLQHSLRRKLGKYTIDVR